MLVPTHSQSPPSSPLTGEMVSDPAPSPPSDDRLGVESLGTSPPLCCQVTVGVGCPVAEQDSVTSEPSTTVMEVSSAVSRGATETEREMRKHGERVREIKREEEERKR